jgi:glycosyltransferase involved in cell wall biosynthesis
MKLISVIVAVYNSAPYLHQCVNSILSQSYEKLEVILVNDGSTDESYYLCEYFKKIDSRVKVIHKENEGLVNSRKTGIQEARGEYICYVDGDDWLLPTFISSFVSEILKNPTDVIIASHYKEFVGTFQRQDNNIAYGYYNKKNMNEKVYPYLISDKSFFRHGVFTYSWGKMYKRVLALEFQLKVPNTLHMGEDAAFLYPLLFKAETISIINYCGYIYRQRANSILKIFENYDKELINLIELLNYLKKELISYDKKSDTLRQIDEYFLTSAISRTGLFLGDNKKVSYLHLLEDIPRNSKICLYNSGSLGQKIYSNIHNTKYYEIVAWIDKDYNESNIMNLPVIAPFEISNLSFDYVIVASVDPFYYEEVITLLCSHNVPINKIKKISINRANISKYVKFLTEIENKD